MIRTKVPQAQLFYASEELYHPPSTNFYVRLNAAVGSWKELCSPLRAAFHEEKNGRPVDPVVYFKIFLVGYLEGIVSDTNLAERVADSLSVREFVGYSPTERTPDHSSLGRVREKFGRDDLLERVLAKTVKLCIEQGLVSGGSAAIDSTLIPANTSLSSLRSVQTGLTVGEHMNRLREANQPVTVSNEEFRSESDPDARLALKAGTPRRMCYKATCVVDESSQVILASQAELADHSDSDAGRFPLEMAQATLQSKGLSLGQVVGDAGYDDAELHAHIEAMGCEPLTNYKEAATDKPEGFTKEAFAYDDEKDVYVCPNGKVLRFSAEDSDGRLQYRSRQGDCRECPFRVSCLSEKGKCRTVGRHPCEASRQRNIERCHTDAGRAGLKRRKSVAEPPFAHMKRLGGLSRVNCRGLGKANVKVQTAAVAWNLLKLVKSLSEEKLKAILTLFSRLLRRQIPRWTSLSRPQTNHQST